MFWYVYPVKYVLGLRIGVRFTVSRLPNLTVASFFPIKQTNLNVGTFINCVILNNVLTNLAHSSVKRRLLYSQFMNKYLLSYKVLNQRKTYRSLLRNI